MPQTLICSLFLFSFPLKKQKNLMVVEGCIHVGVREVSGGNRSDQPATHLYLHVTSLVNHSLYMSELVLYF